MAEGTVEASRSLIGRRIVAVPELAIPLSLGVLAAALYVWAGPGQQDTDGWFPLAQSFLRGDLSIDGSRPWIELVPAAGDRFFLPFPPVPALVLMPVVALFGQEWIDTSAAAGVVGGLNVVLAWFVVRQFTGVRAAAWLTLGFAFGSEALYAAATAGIHLWTETLGMSFELAALALAVRGRAPLAAGILLLLAAGCRPTYLLAAPALALLYATWPLDPESWRRLRAFVLGAIPVGILLLTYNVARFGTPFEFGYARIVGPDGSPVTAEAWYTNGIVSPAYLPRGLYTMLLRGLDFVEEAPWLRPSQSGLSILVTMPILLWLGRATWRSRLVLAGWLGLALPLLLDLMHGLPGYAQFGYRFFLDGLPFAWLLLALVVGRYGLTVAMRVALLVGVAVNVYGLWATTTGFVSS